MELEYPFDNGGLNCAMLEEWYQVQSAASCSAIRAADAGFYLMDMQAYCQCPGREPPMVCQGSFCPTGTGIPTENLSTVIDERMGVTCGDNSLLMKMITKKEDCEFLYATSPMCCKAAADLVFEATAGYAGASAATESRKRFLAIATVFAVIFAL